MSTPDILKQFTPDQLAALQQALNTALPGGRSSLYSKGVHPNNPRQLMDLRKLPTATDPRPTFYWSAEETREGASTPQYRRLMWSPDGREITVTSEADEAAYAKKGYTLQAPPDAEADPTETIRQQLAALSEEDRRTILQAAQLEKRAKLQAKVADLSDEEIATLLEARGRKKAS